MESSSSGILCSYKQEGNLYILLRVISSVRYLVKKKKKLDGKV